jgi:signal recognition particle receptor subunit beta
MWEILSEGMLGFIVIVDSTRPKRSKKRAASSNVPCLCPTPYVVAANKQDQPDAWDLEDIRVALRLDPSTSYCPVLLKRRVR